MTERDNWRRWQDGSRGTYEVWYCTWNHPATGQGFWLRFVAEAPLEGPPRAELWFARFDPRRPERSFGIHRRFPGAAMSSSDSPFTVRIAQSELGQAHSRGELAGAGHDVRWDLRWESAARTLRHLPDLMYLRGGLGETTVQSPNPRVPLSGTVRVDGERLELAGAIAGQTHLWGRKHAHSWTWGRCAELEGADGALLEILGVRLRRGGMVLPAILLLSLDLEGQRHRFNQLRHFALNRGSWGGGRAAFSAWSPSVRVSGEISAAPDRMINARYLDPDGTPVFCANTEIGDGRITVWRRSGLRWLVHRRLEARGRAHFEIGGRAPEEDVLRTHILAP
jgi:hypothetical protein